MSQVTGAVSFEQKLEKLSQLRDSVDVIRLHYEDLEKTNCPDIPDIRAEKDTALEAAQARMEVLKNEIRQWVLTNEQTLKTENVKAQFTRGRRIWDTEGLIRLAEKHPEVLEHLKQGDPYVSFIGL